MRKTPIHEGSLGSGDSPISAPGFLKALYQAKRAHNRLYSVRAFARDLHISHSQLSRILNLKKKITAKTGRLIADRLMLEGALREAFLNGVKQ